MGLIMEIDNELLSSFPYVLGGNAYILLLLLSYSFPRRSDGNERTREKNPNCRLSYYLSYL